MHEIEPLRYALQQRMISPAGSVILHSAGREIAIKAQLKRTWGASVPGELLLATMLIDDSGSIVDDVDALCLGHNKVVRQLQTLSASEIMVCTRTINGNVINPYVPISRPELRELSPADFNDLGATPLYYSSLITLGLALAKANELEMKSIKTHTVTLLLTDGIDESDIPYDQSSAAEVAVVVGDMIATQRHTIIGLGVGDRADFQRIFLEMGIPQDCIFCAEDDVELDKFFDFFAETSARIAVEGPKRRVLLS